MRSKILFRLHEIAEKEKRAFFLFSSDHVCIARESSEPWPSRKLISIVWSIDWTAEQQLVIFKQWSLTMGNFFLFWASFFLVCIVGFLMIFFLLFSELWKNQSFSSWRLSMQWREESVRNPVASDSSSVKSSDRSRIFRDWITSFVCLFFSSTHPSLGEHESWGEKQIIKLWARTLSE